MSNHIFNIFDHIFTKNNVENMVATIFSHPLNHIFNTSIVEIMVVDVAFMVLYVENMVSHVENMVV